MIIKEKSSILVVDDSTSLLMTMKSLLEYYKYNVTTTCSGKKALEFLQNTSYDLVLCDIQMPAMNGLELLNRIKSTIREDLPVILMTGHISADYAVEAIRLGADDFIGKPIDASMIIRAIKQQLSRRDANNFFAKAGNFMTRFQTNYEFSAHDFLQSNLASLIAAPLQQLRVMSPAIFNSLSICLDEMLNNAFVHGTFSLTDEERSMEHDDFINYIKTLLKNELIKEKKIHVALAYNPNNQTVEVSVRDEGKGFQQLVSKSQKNETTLLDFSGTGRGLYLINLLSDEFTISDNGRCMKITKRVQ